MDGATGIFFLLELRAKGRLRGDAGEVPSGEVADLVYCGFAWGRCVGVVVAALLYGLPCGCLASFRR